MSMLKNIFENLPAELKEEFIEEILSSKDFKVERIISEGHTSPPDFWFDQDKNEFVLLLKGKARLSFEDGSNAELKPGDYLTIKAHQKHRVDWTDSNQKTFWLTIHYL
jgi:cupin 2 domain-containing protein